MAVHKIVSQEEWDAARRVLLAEEKDWTRERDRLSAARRALPWVRVDKQYIFDSAQGPATLAQLFDGRTQLIVYHFMFGPAWEEGCLGCSLLSDHVDSARQHFEHNDVSFVAVSRATIGKLETYRRRMGWTFRWLSSANSDFNFDYGVSFTPEVGERRSKAEVGESAGISVFLKDHDEVIYHTYSTYDRGGEMLIGVDPV